MTREMYINLTEGYVITQCRAENVGISAIRTLPGGGTRLVCMSVDGANTMRRKLSKSLMNDDAVRQRHGPGWDFVARD